MSISKRSVLSVIIAIFLFSCRAPAGKESQTTVNNTKTSEVSALPETQQAFLDNLAGLCGKSFTGKETYSKSGRDSWADRKMVMHVTVCDDSGVQIPFHMDEDKSRTWMFLAEDGKLRFRHDHRHEDGTPEDLTLYGGYADGNGTALKQFFPADDYTIDLLTDTLGRRWEVSISDDLSTFSYQLHYSGELMFEAQFDLTKPI